MMMIILVARVWCVIWWQRELRLKVASTPETAVPRAVGGSNYLIGL